jgi:serine/threonine-protein kinase
VVSFQPTAPSRINPEVPPMLDFVVERALKKDPAVRYQDAFELAADLHSALAELVNREAAATEKRERDTTKTIKLDVDALKTALPIPAAGAIGSDTRLPVSRRFDCSDAIGRLKEPTRRDRALLTRAPRPVGFLRRVARDPGRRLLFAAVVVAALVGGAIAFV